MSSLVSIPILVVALILQSVVLSRLPLINGTADLILLVLVSWALQEKADDALFWALLAGIMVSFVSAMPGFAALIAYILIVFLVRQLRRRIWQAPILAMLVAVVVGTIVQHILYIISLFIAGNQLPFQQTISLVTLPSALLNLLFSLPVYILISDLARMLFPVEVEV